MLRCQSVAEAEAAGVAFLAQEVNVAPDLTVAEGLFLKNEPTRFGLIDHLSRQSRAKAALANFGVEIDPATRLGDLDLATQQLVMIVRALSKNARLLILDEPSAARTERETARLFDRMRALRAKGIAIIFVSHRLTEVLEISDRIEIMRDGRVSGALRTASTTREEVVDLMIGQHVQTPVTVHRLGFGAVAVEARGLSVTDATGREAVSGLDLFLRQGEILGLFGLLGSGVIEATMALFGASHDHVSGSILIDGEPVAIGSPADAVALGLGPIAQDRRDGLSAEHSIYDNAILASLARFSRAGFVDAVRARRAIGDLFERLKIKAPDVDAIVGTLSGGNQQKVQVARWLAAGTRIMLLIDPTRGVDVGARAEIKRIWTELAEAACANLLVSSDAEEIVEICDRVVVLRNGRIAAEIGRDTLSESAILRPAAGV